jgi:F-type H+-transporting ATPase subunit gamma
MSDTTASLRHKIKSAGDLQSVVRTMKSLAASSIVQYERSERALRDYARTVELGLSVCFRGGYRERGRTGWRSQPRRCGRLWLRSGTGGPIQ